MAVRCVKTLFERQILCSGTMTDYVMIKRREIQGTTPNTTQADEELTLVADFMGHLEARKPTQRFDGVTISDRVTHVVYIPYDQDIYELDYNTLWVEIEQTRNKNYKMDGIMNLGEQDEYLALFLIERGFVNLEATEA